jgi:hypothetical protein
LILILFLSFAGGCGQRDQSPAANAALNTAKAIVAAEMSPEEAGTHSATITGRVFFKGPAPAPKPIQMNRDPACCPQGGERIYAEEVAINTDSTLRNVFIYIKEGLAQRQFPIPASPAILDQRHCRYEPRVFGIRAGQPLEILNSDRTFHNVHASAQKNTSFNLAMSAVMKVRERSFARAEIMIPIRCNVHPWMIAYAGVLDHPFYDVTGAQGSYKLSALPAGKYVIEAWHEQFGTLSQKVALGEAENQTIDFTFQ